MIWPLILFVLEFWSLLIKASTEGYALKLEWEDLTEELLYESIQKINSHQRYKRSSMHFFPFSSLWKKPILKSFYPLTSFKSNLIRLSQLMHDEIMPSRKVVLRHGGSKHPQSKGMPFYQLYLLDVWLFLLGSWIFVILTTSNLGDGCYEDLQNLKLKQINVLGVYGVNKAI